MFKMIDDIEDFQGHTSSLSLSAHGLYIGRKAVLNEY